MGQTHAELTENLAERLCWEVARRDDWRIARRLYRKAVVDVGLPAGFFFPPPPPPPPPIFIRGDGADGGCPWHRDPVWDASLGAVHLALWAQDVV